MCSNSSPPPLLAKATGNCGRWGEAMLAQFTGLAKTIYNAGEAQTKLQQTSAYYDHAIEKSKPAHHNARPAVR